MRSPGPMGARSLLPIARDGALVIFVLSSVFAVFGGCGPSDSARRAELLADGQGLLATDPSAALQVATKALVEFADDPQFELLASEACMALGRRNDALAHAEQGLAGERELPDELEGDLSWAKGKALMGRFLELGSQDDWRSANTVLERGTQSGNHRVEAAFLVFSLQDLGNHKDDERQLKFARLLVQLDPDGPRTADARALLATKGLSL